MAVHRRAMVFSLAAALVISVVGGYFVSRSRDQPDDETAFLGTSNTLVAAEIPTNRSVQGVQLPAVNLTNLLGAEVSTAELTGQALVINVWATSCAACKRELPVFAEMHQEFGDTVRFVGVNQYANDDIALEFAKSRGVQYELLADLNGDFVTALGITGLPYTLFVAPDGTIVAQKGIELSAQVLRSTLTKTLLG